MPRHAMMVGGGFGHEHSEGQKKKNTQNNMSPSNVHLVVLGQRRHVGQGAAADIPVLLRRQVGVFEIHLDGVALPARSRPQGRETTPGISPSDFTGSC
jgi:hypothetical protein